MVKRRRAKIYKERFEVEKILGVRYRRGKAEYWVKWKGYVIDPKYWEPACHLIGAMELIEEFHNEEDEKKRDQEGSVPRTQVTVQNISPEAPGNNHDQYDESGDVYQENMVEEYGEEDLEYVRAEVMEEEAGEMRSTSGFGRDDEELADYPSSPTMPSLLPSQEHCTSTRTSSPSISSPPLADSVSYTQPAMSITESPANKSPRKRRPAPPPPPIISNSCYASYSSSTAPSPLAPTFPNGRSPTLPPPMLSVSHLPVELSGSGFHGEDSLLINTTTHATSSTSAPAEVPQAQNVDDSLEENISEPVEICGCYGQNGEVYFLVKMFDENLEELVPLKVANLKWPQTVIRFYESRIIWNTNVDLQFED